MPYPDRSRPGPTHAPSHRPRHSRRFGTPPLARTSFVGREAEQDALRTLLRSDVAIVTLTGPGGVGKTRLALQAAASLEDDYLDGILFVDLSVLRDASQVLPRVAQVAGITGTGKRDAADLLAAVLGPLQVLVVLDNVEHVLEAATSIASLLDACPALQVLATSRAPLRLYGEHLVPLHPLPLPASEDLPDGILLRNEAVRLFLDRAITVDPTIQPDATNLHAISEICRRLDGLPLAIELAAARSSLFQPPTLLTHLSERLGLLSDGPSDRPSRHQTLRATIAWSYDLLQPDMQALFRRLGIFDGGFDARAATALRSTSSGTVVQALGTLVDQSLVYRTSQSCADQRFALLETTREFAWEQLRVCHELEDAQHAHAEYFLQFAERIEADIYGPSMHDGLDQLEVEYPNCRAALRLFVEAGDSTRELRLAAMLSEYWSYRGRVMEGVAALRDALDRSGDAPPGPRSKAMSELAFLEWLHGDHDRALALTEEAIPLARQDGNLYRLAQVLFVRASVLAGPDEPFEETISLLQEALDLMRRDQPDGQGYGYLIAELGWAWLRAGDRQKCLALIEQAMELFQTHGLDFELGWTHLRLGRIDYQAGKHRHAARHYAEALRSFRDAGVITQIGFPMSDLCGLLHTSGHRTSAERLGRTIRWITEQTGAEFSREPIGPPAPIHHTRGSHGRPAIENTVPSNPPLPVYEAIDEAITAAEALADGRTPPSEKLATPSHSQIRLSSREQAVLTLLAQRYTAPEIADQLYISVRTVERHVANVYNKLGVNSRRAAAAVAVQYGLL